MHVTLIRTPISLYWDITVKLSESVLSGINVSTPCARGYYFFCNLIPDSSRWSDGNLEGTRLISTKVFQERAPEVRWNCAMPGGYSTNVYTWRLRSEVQPLNLFYTIFHEKGIPLSHTLFRNFASLLTAVNALSFTDRSQSQKSNVSRLYKAIKLIC